MKKKQQMLYVCRPDDEDKKKKDLGFRLMGLEHKFWKEKHMDYCAPCS